MYSVSVLAERLYSMVALVELFRNVITPRNFSNLGLIRSKAEVATRLMMCAAQPNVKKLITAQLGGEQLASDGHVFSIICSQ